MSLSNPGRIAHRAVLSIVLLLSLAWPAEAQEFDYARRIKPETDQLDNGMQIVVIPDHRVPVVTHMLWYKVGAADEVAGKSGLAHFFEHLLFKGTPSVPGMGYSNIIARNGGNENAGTSWDFTFFFARVAKDRLPLIMQLEADRMVNLTLTEEVFLPERDVILEERASRIDNNPSATLREQMGAALYANSRYGVPVIGWAHEIANLSIDDALSFYKTYYVPNDAILVVSGDVTMAEVKPLAEKYYGALKPGEIPPRVRATEPPARVARRVELHDKRVQQPSWSRWYLAPSANTAPPGESAALEVLSAILGEGPRSRLYRRLVIEEGKAAGAGSGYYTESVTDQDFTIGVTPRPGVTLAEVEALVDEEITRLVEEGVTQEELDGAVKTLLNDAIFALDSPMTLNYIFGQTLAAGGTIERVLQWPEDIRGVTPQKVQLVAQKYLQPERSVTGLLLPEEGE